VKHSEVGDLELPDGYGPDIVTTDDHDTIRVHFALHTMNKYEMSVHAAATQPQLASQNTVVSLLIEVARRTCSRSNDWE